MDPAPPAAGLQLAPIPRDRGEDVLVLDQWAFGHDDEGIDPAPVLEAIEWDRAFGMWTSGPEPRLVGSSLTHSFDLPVPGAGVACAGLTWVGVHPQFRRRGILRTMMTHHLATLRERGSEPVAALFTAEPAIYGRFGYGLATYHLRMRLPRKAALREVPGAAGVRVVLEPADADRHADLIGDCYEAARRTRPGMVSRNTAALRRIPLLDQPFMRQGGERLKVALAVDSDAPDPVPGQGGRLRGYALFRRKADWGDAGPDGTVRVRELVARDPAAARALWGCLTDLDLTARVETDMRPVDDPLVRQLVDLRATAARYGDGLWVRLVDVPAALAGRRYAGDVEAVLEVMDELCPWNAGRWQLKGSPDGASCERTSAPADLALDVRELAACYLGGVSPAALASAGLVRELRPGALVRVSTALGWPVAPYCGWVF